MKNLYNKHNRILCWSNFSAPGLGFDFHWSTVYPHLALESQCILHLTLFTSQGRGGLLHEQAFLRASFAKWNVFTSLSLALYFTICTYKIIVYHTFCHCSFFFFYLPFIFFLSHMSIVQVSYYGFFLLKNDKVS